LGALRALFSSAAPTLSGTGFTGATVTANNGTGAFQIGSIPGTAVSGVVTFPYAATTQWNCYAFNNNGATASSVIATSAVSPTQVAIISETPGNTATQVFPQSAVNVSCLSN
jgi:hypothetical protein